MSFVDKARLAATIRAMRFRVWIQCIPMLCFAALMQAAERAELPQGVRPIQTPGIHNAFQLSTNLYSGSSPESDEAFAALAQLGIKTIVSVDGGKPNVELARKFGMRYVHLPHGYDGIGRDAQAKLIQAARSFSGPLFVHCHHGLHRGPAAAAVISMANCGWSTRDGEAFLKAAGTGSNYVGLYRTVNEFQPPSAEQLRSVPASLLEVASVSGLIEAMVEIEERWGHLKAVRKAGYQAPKEHPDIQPAHEAVILWEHYREAQRFIGSTGSRAAVIDSFKKAEFEAREAEQLLRVYPSQPTPEIRARLDATFDSIAASCVACHKAYRDSPQ